MARNVYGLDLGTYEVKVYDKKNDTIWKEKNVIAIENENHIFSVGDEAFEMYEKAPDNIQVVFPMKEGVISRFNDMQYLLHSFLKRDQRFARGGKYVIAVPTDVTEVEKRAFFDLVIHSAAKAKEVNIVERGVADALGLGLDVQAAKGIFIANFGGEITELSVMSEGGLVLNKLVKIGGAYFDNSIADLVRHSHDFLIGRITSETLRKNLGVFEGKNSKTMRVAGRDLINGIPKQMDISVNLIRAAMKEPLKMIVEEIMSIIERTPPEVLTSIQKNGIYVTGGLANLKGLSAYIEGATGFKVTVPKNPELCVIEGLKKVILTKELQKMAYSMLDENYRWMR